jgi:molecular chaperone GrpE
MTDNNGARAEEQEQEDESAVKAVREVNSEEEGPDSEESVPSNDDKPIDELEVARQAADENLNKYLRLAAEMDNLRKRTVRDVENARKYGIERFATELLAVIDSLEMGLQAASTASVESLREGQEATYKLLLGAVEKSGIEIIDPEGEPFDPELHEAMTMQPSATAEPGSILSVIQKGYRLNKRLLRPARVVVASEPGNQGN